MEEVLLKLIDIMKDLNKSVSMHVDNHGAEHVDHAIQNVAESISDKLVALDKQLRSIP